MALNVNNPNDFVNFFTFGTIAVAATSTSVSGAFTSANSINAPSVMVYNPSANVVFVAFGISTSGGATAVAATGTESANAIPIPPGAIMVFTKNNGYDTMAAIAPSANTTVYFSAGIGA